MTANKVLPVRRPLLPWSIYKHFFVCYNLDGIQDENVVVKETGILVQLKNFLGAFFLVSIECLSSVDTVFDIAFYITNFAYFCGLL